MIPPGTFSSPEQSNLSPDLTAAREFAAEQFPGFKEVDMQFNLGSFEGAPERALDILVGPENNRYLITQGTDLASESLVASRLGKRAILTAAQHITETDVTAYRVPRGARLLAKTLRQPPYTTEYMNRLAGNLGRFVRRVRELDEGMFGVPLYQIAVTHDGNGDTGRVYDRRVDDINLTLVPPLQAQGVARPLSPQELAMQNRWIFATQEQVEHFVAGMGSEK